MRRVIRLSVALMVLSAVVAGVLLPQRVQAQDDFDRVRRIVQQWLLETLDKPHLALVEYTYAAASWEDSSLGCPVEGEAYTSEVVNGYRWTFTFDNFVRYEVHSGLFGDPIVLCSGVNVTGNMPLSVYSAPAFDVLVPEAWLNFANNARTEVLFGPGTGTACAQAGMRVTVVGTVAAGVTPDDLLDDYLADFTAAEDARVPVGSFGRSDRFDLPCGERTSQGRVTLIVQGGTAYRIEQWASADEFDNWDTLFLDVLTQFSPKAGAAVASTPTAPVTPAPTTTGVPLEGTPLPAASAPIATPGPGGTAVADAAAPVEPETLAALPIAHIFLGDLFLGTLDNLPGRSVTMTPDQDRRYLHFAPNGRMLAYVDAAAGDVRVMDAVEGLSPRKVASGVHPAFPPAWSPESAQIAYVVDTGERDDDAALLAVYSVSAQGGDSVLLGGFHYRDGCSVASSDPADHVFFSESGAGGVQNVLVWLSVERVLVSTGCAGGIGVMLPAEQQIIELGEDLHGGVVSPDRARFLARTDAGLAVLDFAEWQRRNIALGTPAQQIAWGPDGQTVYYATATQTDTLTLDDDAQQASGEAFFGLWPVTVNVYALTLVQLDLRSDQPAILWQGRGRGIGRIVPAPDSSGVLFTLVPSSLPLAEVFQAGGDAMARLEAQPQTALYWLGTGSERARLLAYSAQPAFGAPDLFAAGVPAE